MDDLEEWKEKTIKRINEMMDYLDELKEEIKKMENIEPIKRRNTIDCIDSAKLCLLELDIRIHFIDVEGV